MNQKQQKINLSQFRSANSKILSGRDEGFAAREKLKLTEMEKAFEEIIVHVPKDTWSFNSSFFLGLFTESIRTHGEVYFKNKYKFECSDTIREDVEDGVKQALKNKTALGG